MNLPYTGADDGCSGGLSGYRCHRCGQRCLGLTADEESRDAALPVEDECRRRRWRDEAVQPRQEDPGLVLQRGIRDVVYLVEATGVAAVVLDVDADEHDAELAGLTRDLYELRRLGSAGRAPRRPEIHDDHLTAVVSQVK